MRKRGNTLLAVCVFLLCLSGVVVSQEVAGTIAGVVKDATGAVIPEAAITARNVGTNASYTGRTSQLGTYTIRNLPVGIYRLTAEVAGFKRYEATDIRLQVNEVSRVDIVLEVGQVTESVEVRAQVVAVNTEDATLRTVIDQQRVQDLPLNGRDPVQLMRLVAGVSLCRGSGVTSGTTYPGVVAVSVNGSRGNATKSRAERGELFCAA